MSDRWVPSRFNALRTVEGELVLYNSMTGAIVAVPPGTPQETVRTALRQGFGGPPRGVLAELTETGHFVPAGTDELRRARVVREVEGNATDNLHLIIMPTEQCNFRCTYCYETFERGEMSPDLRAGVKKFVASRARRLRSLYVGWFGGEPLTAVNTVRELSQAFLESCQEHGVTYLANMTTNGYNLTPELIPDLLAWQIRQFQITLDGTAATHDKHRKLMGGQATFDRIFQNLKALAAQDEEFFAMIRINYDSEVLRVVPELLDQLGEHFGGDPRFGIWPRPVSNLGGPLAGTFETCSETALYQVMEQGMQRGLRAGSVLRSHLQPHGSVCYAAKPTSFVIGSDGTVYKCTVALTDERNKVGRLHPDGRLALNMDRFALWVTHDEQTDAGCQKCFFRPACQGNACPWERMVSGEAPCPSWKERIGDALRVVALESKLLAAPTGAVVPLTAPMD